MVKIAIISSAIMYFLYRFQMKKTNVFMGFTNQLKDVFGRLGRKERARFGEGLDKGVATKLMLVAHS